MVQPDANSSSSLASRICRTKIPQIRRSAAGFTLIEMAVAVFILALLLGSILVPLQTQIESRKTDETQRILDQARDALIGYAAANGRFPCPARDSSTGAESFATFPTAGNPTNGICNPLVAPAADVYAGFLPAVTLGFTPVDANGYAVDSWGLAQNRIRYAVSRTVLHNGTTTVTNPFTKTDGMRSVTMPRITSPENPLGTAVFLLHVCNTASASATDCSSAAARLAFNVPVVIWSLGPNAATGGTSADEIENLDNDRIFVSRTKSGGTGGVFDDIVTWIGAPTLLNRQVRA
jgi:prepilin-type N-terminal cleavage/methylation domain-containing protein